MSGYFLGAFIILSKHRLDEWDPILKQSVSESSLTVNFVGERPLGQVGPAPKESKRWTIVV
jgi:hypothetical protein